MTVRILFFSLLEDIVGKRECDFNLPDGKYTVRLMLDQVYLEWPELKEWDTIMLVALDLNYVDTATEVVEGQTLALMPPLQGG